jgi:hypothetical protein
MLRLTGNLGENAPARTRTGMAIKAAAFHAQYVCQFHHRGTKERESWAGIPPAQEIS